MQEIENIVALDLGSSLIKIVVGRPVQDSEIEIIGTATASGVGIKNGAIINIEATTKSITEAVQAAVLMSGQEISDVIINITGKTIKADNSKGVVAITNKEKTVSIKDIERVIEAATQNIRIANDQEILHVLSREFSVDDQTNIKEPLGMTGIRLEGEVHVVSAGLTTLNNLDRCIEQSGLNLIDKVLSSFASSEAILTSSDKDHGCAVIDIGAGITDIVIYVDGGVAFSGVVPFGGYNITNDISIGLKTPLDSAEIIKKKYGHASFSAIDPTEKLEVPSMGGRAPKVLSRQDLVSIIEPRMREILEHINVELERSGKKANLAGGVFLTGGTSQLRGIAELAEEILGLQVAIAKPAGLSGLADKVALPEYSTAVGLIKYAVRSYSIDRKSNAGWNTTFEKDNPLKKAMRWIEDNL